MTNPPDDHPSPPRISGAFVSPFDRQRGAPTRQESAEITVSAPTLRAAVPAAAAAAAGDRDLMAIKRAGVTALVAGMQGRTAFRSTARESTATNAILGIGVGIRPPQSRAPGIVSDSVGPADEPAINLYVRRKLTAAEARQAATQELRIDAFKDDRLPLNVIVTGEVKALAWTGSLRPAPNGISVGVTGGETGTSGCLATGLNPPRNTRLLLISNNHVIANCNAAKYGDPIIQPGTKDGGAAASQIGVLERFITLDFARANEVDAACAWVDQAQVSSWIYNTGPMTGNRYDQLTTPPTSAQNKRRVGKAGRSSDTVPGQVFDITTSIPIVMPNGRQAQFDNQISISDLDQPFAALGDSGAVVWLWDTYTPVGLIVARGAGTTFCNHIDLVLAKLDLQIYR